MNSKAKSCNNARTDPLGLAGWFSELGDKFENREIVSHKKQFDKENWLP